MGTWEDANKGAGVGGTGTLAAKKVLEFFNRRGIDDPEASGAAPGVPRITTIGLLPMQSCKRRRPWSCYSNCIPINVKHPDDLEPSNMGDSVAKRGIGLTPSRHLW